MYNTHACTPHILLLQVQHKTGFGKYFADQFWCHSSREFANLKAREDFLMAAKVHTMYLWEYFAEGTCVHARMHAWGRGAWQCACVRVHMGGWVGVSLWTQFICVFAVWGVDRNSNSAFEEVRDMLVVREKFDNDVIQPYLRTQQFLELKDQANKSKSLGAVTVKYPPEKDRMYVVRYTDRLETHGTGYTQFIYAKAGYMFDAEVLFDPAHPQGLTVSLQTETLIGRPSHAALLQYARTYQRFRFSRLPDVREFRSARVRTRNGG